MNREYLNRPVKRWLDAARIMAQWDDVHTIVICHACTPPETPDAKMGQALVYRRVPVSGGGEETFGIEKEKFSTHTGLEVSNV